MAPIFYVMTRVSARKLLSPSEVRSVLLQLSGALEQEEERLASGEGVISLPAARCPLPAARCPLLQGRVKCLLALIYPIGERRGEVFVDNITILIGWRRGSEEAAFC